MSRAIGGSVLLAAMLGLIIALALTSSSLSGSSYATEAASYVGNNASLTAPILKDPTGKPLTTLPKVGQMVVISTTLASNTTNSNASSASADSSIPFIVIVEARNELGVTEYSQFAIGRLMNGGSNSSSEVGLSWTPDASGVYELKAFALSDLNDPVLLALPESSIATVQQ